MKKYNSIDLIKLVMAALVVAIHTIPMYNHENFWVARSYRAVVSCAVPFFFMVSGFFLGNKMKYPYHEKTDRGVLTKYLKKMILLYSVWSIMYIPLAVDNYIDAELTLKESVMDYIRGFLFVGEHYNSWMLWYLLSTVYALFFVYILLKKKVKLQILLLIGFCVTILGYGIDYLYLFSNESTFVINAIIKVIDATILHGRIFQGFFYIPLGMCFANYKISVSKSWILFIAGFIATMITDDMVYYLFQMICMIGLFSLVIQWELKESKVYWVCRQLSTIIYFIHMYVWVIFYTVVKGRKTYRFNYFVATVLICIAIGLVYIGIKALLTKLRRKIRND